MEQTLSMAERVELGLSTTVIGLAIVLCVLAILWGVLELFRIVFHEAPKKKAAAAKAAAPQATVAKADPVVVSPVAAEEDETELIAVLTAAVAVSMGAAPGSLRIKSYRRTDASGPIWNRVSRKEQLDNTL